MGTEKLSVTVVVFMSFISQPCVLFQQANILPQKNVLFKIYLSKRKKQLFISQLFHCKSLKQSSLYCQHFIFRWLAVDGSAG